MSVNFKTDLILQFQFLGLGIFCFSQNLSYGKKLLNIIIYSAMDMLIFRSSSCVSNASNYFVKTCVTKKIGNPRLVLQLL